VQLSNIELLAAAILEFERVACDTVEYQKSDACTDEILKTACAYANDYDDYHGRVDKEVWDKMLDVVADERRKAIQELDELTDDSAESRADVPEAGQDTPDPSMAAMAASFELDKPCKASWEDNAVRTLDRLASWTLYSMTFCFLFGVAGLDLSAREIIAYSLMLGLVVGSINNIERVMRELFKQED
jgi:hypothetical protein